MYQGADRHSNNAGELTALLRAVQEEHHGQGHVTFVVDSTYAITYVINMAMPFPAGCAATDIPVGVPIARPDERSQHRDERAQTLC